jgi:hypothetical protein
VIHAALLTTWLVAAGSAVQARPSEVLVLEIFAHLYRGDGSRSASGGDSDPAALEGYVWSSSGCGDVAASGKPPANAPAVGWHYSGRVIDRTADSLTVRIEWERVRDRSMAPGDKPLTGNTTATLRRGDLLELDRMLPTGQVSCQTAIIKLEASTELGSPTPGGRGSGTGGGRSGVGAGSGGGSGAGRAAGSAGSGSGAGSGGGVGAGSIAGPSYTAELWLVHHPPNAAEETQRLVVRLGDNSAFVFPAVPVPTAQGKADVEVSGVLRLLAGGESDRLFVAITRRVAAAGQPDRTGNSGRIIPLPAPADVISFVLPSSAPSPQDWLAGHQFSLRLRIAPK